jgi:SWI/SNF-related matrix-associated actin-dependent regulator of chromatin subfamily A member 5
MVQTRTEQYSDQDGASHTSVKDNSTSKKPNKSSRPDSRFHPQQAAFLLSHLNSILPLLPENSDLHEQLTLSLSDDNHTEIPMEQLTEQPAGLTGTLREHQIQGLSWLVNLHKNHMSGLLADDMGLGKTIQITALLQYLHENHKDDASKHLPHLIVCPLSIVTVWCGEIAKWAPDINIGLMMGDPKQRNVLKRIFEGKTEEPIPDVIITSYDTLRKEHYWFKKNSWRYLVLDEAHHAKNSETEGWETFSKMTAEYWVLLTGTPIQNNLKELW